MVGMIFRWQLDKLLYKMEKISRRKLCTNEYMSQEEDE